MPTIEFIGNPSSTVQIIGGNSDQISILVDAPGEPEILEVLGMQGPKGLTGESGLQAEVSTDFAFIYRLST